jgi:hypothetical protein
MTDRINLRGPSKSGSFLVHRICRLLQCRFAHDQHIHAEPYTVTKATPNPYAIALRTSVEALLPNSRLREDLCPQEMLLRVAAPSFKHARLRELYILHASNQIPF